MPGLPGSSELTAAMKTRDWVAHKKKMGWAERPNPFSFRSLNYFLNLLLPNAASPIKPIPSNIIVAGSGTAAGTPFSNWT
jgi:hypothetical protein